MEQINPIVEDTTGAAAPEIATTDENLSVGQMYQETSLPSLGRQIFSVLEVSGPTAALFNVRKKAGLNDIELLRNEVEVFPSESINTGITQEAVQDLRSQYSQNANQLIGTLLRGLSNDQENTRTLTFLDTNAALEPALTLTDSGNSVSVQREIQQKANALILKANSESQRTFGASVVLPYAVASAFAAMDTSEQGLYVGKNGRTKFFMNPDAAATDAYVVLKDETNPSRSAAVFSPYTSDIIEAQNPDTGANTYHIYNRFAITASPLHEAGKEMMFKFAVNL